MNQQKKIIIPDASADTLIEQIKLLYLTFRQFPPGDSVIFDFSSVKWVYPAFILPLSAYIQSTQSSCTVDTESNVASYLNTIAFPYGIDTVSAFQMQKSYTPIGVLMRQNIEQRKMLEDCFLHMIYKILGAMSGTQSVLYYPISELVANIFEHGAVNKGFIFGQYYPTKDYLDLCIVDRGRGLARSYKEEINLSVTDEEAIGQVMRGRSTKSDVERGFGIRTSKQVVCKALGGGFVLISGSAMLVAHREKETVTTLKDFYWQGVIVAYRINRPTRPIDISPYVE